LISSVTNGVADSRKAQLPNALGPERAEVLTEDLATFLVAHYVLVTKNDSIQGIKEYFRPTADIYECVEEIIVQLEAVGLLSVSGDKVTIAKSHIDLGSDPNVLSRFLPRLFNRLLKNAKAGVLRNKREGLRYFVLPDRPDVANEAKALYLEYKAKMLALIERAEKEDVPTESIRLVGVFNCALNPEDFV
jgi:hypothetical protein